MALKVLCLSLRIFLPLVLMVVLSAEAQGLTLTAPMLTTAPGAKSVNAATDSTRQASRSTSSMPLEKVRITSKFGRRKHPVLRKIAFHSGVDMKAKLNDKVKTVSDGIVTFAGPRGALGNAVFISHPKLKATSIYGHLNKVVVKRGKQVSAGAVIGYAGTTGRSTGVHLHLTVKDQTTGKSVEPISFLNSIPRKIKLESQIATKILQKRHSVIGSRKALDTVASAKPALDGQKIFSNKPAAYRVAHSPSVRLALPPEVKMPSKASGATKVLAHQKEAVSKTIIAADFKAKAKAISRQSSQTGEDRPGSNNERINDLRAAVAQAVIDAKKFEDLYTEGIVARKSYLAAEARVNELREQLKIVGVKS